MTTNKFLELAIAQQQEFTRLLEKLGEISQEEAELMLSQCELIPPDNGLNRENITQFKDLIDRKKNEQNNQINRSHSSIKLNAFINILQLN